MMLREPAAIPALRGVYALLNRKRRFVYVAYTQNLQKRSHSMSHMLMNYDRSRRAYWPIKELPKHGSDEFTFVVLATNVSPERALAAIAAAQRGFTNKNYSIVAGHRAGTPVIKLAGQRVSLAEAVRQRKQLKYPTVYRRLQRGWSVRQALGLDPPDPRWDHDKIEARRKRAA
jgi:hypothetical protein